ncbi:sugar transferase [Cesiribacter andamanensis]|uniref:Putative colanic biosynthesis UDP-glucose lipid carrier transferase n=1 Tax=Cesiribacter andamanensis AMV16 TaxID=1279009 RepID=M7N2T1_9BACT|nr:sugar transferase [Cesiribacter andamanensis]EMR02983.1 Putative colanic biosynthesis UDP-glucose lipid carrier transferase [Cesiribacter andamanensis AMV16]
MGAHRYSKFLNSLQILGDLAVINIAFAVAFYSTFGHLGFLSEFLYAELYYFFNISWLVLTALNKPFQIARTEVLSKVLRRQIGLLTIHLLVFTAFIFFGNIDDYSRQHLLLTYAFLLVLDFGWKGMFFYSLQAYRTMGYNTRNVVIMGYGELSEELSRHFEEHPEYGYRMFGCFDNHVKGNKILGKMEDLKEFALRHNIDEIYCCLPYVRYQKVKELLDFADANIIKVKLITDFRGFSKKGIKLEQYNNIPVLNISAIPLDELKNKVFKRTFDIVFSMSVLLLISPVLLMVGLMVKITSKGPVFFSQERIGKDGVPFKIYKFRSMRVDAELAGPALSSDCDPRITKWGKIMRKTRLDELPQFYNVLRGDMAVVGPRPERQFWINQIVEKSPHYKRLLRVKPGITSLGQVKFGYAENVGEMLQRLRFDLLYIDNASMRLDMRVMMMTALVMVQGKGK